LIIDIEGAEINLFDRVTELGRVSKISIAALQKDHSITSSARTSTLGGIVKPSAAATFVFTISSKAVAC
jgi:hypothetical protein